MAGNDAVSSLPSVRWHMTSISPITGDANWSLKVITTKPHHCKVLFFPLWLTVKLWITFFIKHSIYLFIFVSMDSWVPILFHGLSFITSLFWCLNYPTFGQWEPLQAGICLTCPHHSLSISLPVEQDSSGSSCTFPALPPELAISPGSSGRF